MRKIKLPVNEKPEMISYTHNAFTSAILNSEIIGGEVAAKYEIISNHKNFQKKENCCKAEIGKEVVVNTSIMSDCGYSYLFDICEEKETFILKVNFRRKTSSREHICIVLDDFSQEDDFNPEKLMTRFGVPSGLRIIVKRREEYLEEKNSKKVLSMGYYLKLEKDNLQVTYSYSPNGKKWSKVYEETLPKRYEVTPLKIGVIVETKNDYMNWKASNYVQMYMKSPAENMLMIDYYVGPTKHYKTFFTNQIFDYLFEYVDYDKYSCRKMAKYIFGKLQESFYIIASIDHYYVPKSYNYKKSKFFHEVLVYGVDFTKKIYNIMAYGENSEVIITDISFSEFWKGLDSNQIMFILGRINLNYNRYEINKSVISKRLREYLEGTNSDEHVADIVPGQDIMVYGIDIFKYLVDHEDELYIYCKDSRLSYAVYEHKKLMIQRFVYLQNNGAFKTNVPPEIWEALKRDMDIAEIVKNNVLMSTMGNNKKSTMEKIRNYLKEMISIEEDCYNKLCKLLEE